MENLSRDLNNQQLIEKLLEKVRFPDELKEKFIKEHLNGVQGTSFQDYYKSWANFVSLNVTTRDQ